MGQRNLKINTPVSHLGCWCNSSRKQATNSVSKKNRSRVQ
jgi:hypothetical protein